jgi:hypothetical protein
MFRFKIVQIYKYLQIKKTKNVITGNILEKDKMKKGENTLYGLWPNRAHAERARCASPAQRAALSSIWLAHADRRSTHMCHVFDQFFLLFFSRPMLINDIAQNKKHTQYKY